MTREMEMYTLKKHVKTVHVPKDLHINKCWQFLRKDTADHIGGVGYTAVPYFFDAKCYQIGHIFVKEASNVNFEKKKKKKKIRARVIHRVILSYIIS